MFKILQIALVLVQITCFSKASYAVEVSEFLLQNFKNDKIILQVAALRHVNVYPNEVFEDHVYLQDGHHGYERMDIVRDMTEVDHRYSRGQFSYWIGHASHRTNKPVIDGPFIKILYSSEKNICTAKIGYSIRTWKNFPSGSELICSVVNY